MKQVRYLLLIPAILLMSMKSDKPAYRLFDIKGKKASYTKMLNQALESDIVLFGELHNNPICHWLQYELTADLHKEAGERLVLGAEMFEHDGQLILDEYINGSISTSSFESQARLWPNYKTDYKPLVEFARSHRLRFIATNIPRRYASVVFREGFEGLDSLESEAQRYIAPLPVPYDPSLPGYQAMLDMGGGAMGGHASDNFPKAQAIKDATMAHFILNNLHDTSLFVHYHGTYHSNGFEGITWYLNQYRPGLKIMTIASAEQESIEELNGENTGIADFILIIPQSMTKTH